MNITTEERVNLIVDIDVLMTKYSNINGNYRPSISDYATYALLMEFYSSDMDQADPDTIWKYKPDEVFAKIINDNKQFEIDFGWEDMVDSIRDYLTENNLVVYADDLSEEEYQQLLEAK